MNTELSDVCVSGEYVVDLPDGVRDFTKLFSAFAWNSFKFLEKETNE